MSRFRGYDNAANRNNVRIDARPRNDEASQAGMRGVHRDTRGNVIGGYTAEGAAIGTKSKFRQMGGGMSRLAEGPQTPGLDRLAAMQKPTATTVDSPAPSSFVDQERAAQERSAASGAFGKGAQNRAGRRSLFRDMQLAGGGAITPEMEGRAKTLGVGPGRFRAAAQTLPSAPAMLARQSGPAVPSKPPATGIALADPAAAAMEEANKAFPVGPKVRRPSWRMASI